MDVNSEYGSRGATWSNIFQGETEMKKVIAINNFCSYPVKSANFVQLLFSSISYGCFMVPVTTTERECSPVQLSTEHEQQEGRECPFFFHPN